MTVAPTEDAPPQTSRVFPSDFGVSDGKGRLRYSGRHKPAALVDIASGRTAPCSKLMWNGIGAARVCEARENSWYAA